MTRSTGARGSTSTIAAPDSTWRSSMPLTRPRATASGADRSCSTTRPGCKRRKAQADARLSRRRSPRHARARSALQRRQDGGEGTVLRARRRDGPGDGKLKKGVARKLHKQVSLFVTVDATTNEPGGTPGQLEDGATSARFDELRFPARLLLRRHYDADPSRRGVGARSSMKTGARASRDRPRDSCAMVLLA